MNAPGTSRAAALTPAPAGPADPHVEPGSARMFESDFLERFSRVHPATPAVLYLPLVAYCLTRAVSSDRSAASIALHVFLGYLVWTLFEYWLHRLVFHLKVVGPKTARAHFLIHGVHHDYPWDLSRLVIPLVPSLVMAVVFFFSLRALFGAAMYPGFAGFVAGYVLYDSLHWYVHARAPRSRFFRWLRREHLVHHFKDPNNRFGVSCPWLDHLFGTTGRPSGGSLKDPV